MSKLNLTSAEQKNLLMIARETLTAIMKGERQPEVDPGYKKGGLNLNLGIFVTLTSGGKLRGCLGRFTSSEPLYKLVREMTLNAAIFDNRFEPVTSDEIDDIEIEISVIGPMEKIDSAEGIIIGKHGLYIKKGDRSGTLLPQVAVKMGWNREEFLGHTSRDKANIGWCGWHTADIYVYEAQVFSEKG